MYCQLQKTYKSNNRFFTINVEITFKLNAINVLYGNSGAGKTSVLRLISGLDKAENGVIKVNNIEWLNTKNNFSLPLAKRNIAYVFQNYGLFPNMSVLENLEFAKKKYDKILLKEILKNLELESLLNSKPNNLSGGQQQRVALARAILQEPDFLFLDESLSAIDEVLRQKIQNYLIDLQQNKQFTIIMVSHHLPEVLKMAEYVCVIDFGQLILEGSPKILLSENKTNTIKGLVLNINDDLVTIVVGYQKINVLKDKISTLNYSLNSEVEFFIS